MAESDKQRISIPEGISSNLCRNRKEIQPRKSAERRIKHVTQPVDIRMEIDSMSQKLHEDSGEQNCNQETAGNVKRIIRRSERMKNAEKKSESLNFSNLSTIMKTLERQFNIKHELKYDLHNRCCCIYFQDKQMEDFLNFYPEFVCIDILCEIVELELSLCLLISEDSNAHCEIIGACLIRGDGIENFAWMCETFKKYNSCWRNTKIIVSDRQGVMLESIQNSFPVALVFVSFFHTLKALKRDLSNLDVGITSYLLNEVIQIFEGMIFANSEGEYTELLNKMRCLHFPLFEFFQQNWHPKRDIWALGLKFNSKTHLNSINNFLFVIRKKVRPVVIVQTTVENVVKGVLASLAQLRKKRYQKVTPIFQTLQIPLNNKSYLYRKYIKFLTHYASDLVVQQLNVAAGIKSVEKVSNGIYKIDGLSITISSCSCIFYSLMSLPCSHIFALRKLLSLPLFAEALCAIRWTSSYYQSSYLALQGSYISETNKSQSQAEKNIAKEQFQKYFEISGQLLPLLLECPNDVLQQRINVFQNLLAAWKNGFKVNVNAAESQNLFPTSNNHIALEDLSTDRWKEIYGISMQDILDSDNDFSSVSLCSEASSDEI